MSSNQIEQDDFDWLDAFSASENVPETFEDAIEIEARAVPDADIVDTESEEKTADGTTWVERERRRRHDKKENPGRDPRAFQKHREAKAADFRRKVLEFARLLASGKNIRQAASEIGVSYEWARQAVWPAMKKFQVTDYMAPEEKERIGVLVVESLETVLRTALSRMTEHAAYGAVAISAAKELRETMGIDFKAKATGDGATTDLEALGEQIREAMPALMDHHEHIAKIKMRQLERKALEAAAGAGA